MLVVADLDRLVDEQHGDAVFDAVGAPQPWVVEQLVTGVAHEDQRTSIGRADKNAQ